jgi:rod shape determining protein RodA
MNRNSFDFDSITLFLYLGLVLLGWLTIFAVTSTSGDIGLFDSSYAHGKQFLWIGISVVVALIVLVLDNRFLEGSSYVVYGISMTMLILVLFFGAEVNGAKSWLVIAGQRFQPSEFAKVATAMALARYMSTQNFSFNNLSQALVAFSIILLPGLIVILQNDTGSALVFGSFLIVFFREGLNPLIPILLLTLAGVAIVTLWLGSWMIAAGIIAVVAAISFLYFFEKRHWGRTLINHLLVLVVLCGFSFSINLIVSQLKEHQRNRILVWFNPDVDPQGKGYNVIQSKIAIGSGGLSGKGFLQGNYTKYKFVPKQETDFIFCTIGEERGWLGASAIVLLFFALIWRSKFLAENSKTRYARVYGYSVVSILFFHVMVNVGMTIGLMPVIGIPLPFFSYGGSSLLAFTVMIFILVNLYSYRATVLGSKY